MDTIGPYIMTKIHAKGTHCQQQVENHERNVQRVSSAHLKPYHLPVDNGEDKCARKKRNGWNF